MAEENNIINERYENRKKGNKKEITDDAVSKPTAYAGPDQIVYEESDVELDGSRSASHKEKNDNSFHIYDYR